MKRIYDWDAKFTQRNYTVDDLKALKGQRLITQTNASSAEEAAAAQEAGIDLIMGDPPNVAAVREGAPNMFLTAALALPDYPAETDVLRAAFNAMKDGADSVYTARPPHIVELLAREEIPVMCHLGLVPRKSTWRGGLRAIGKNAEEAMQLLNDFRTMENAGAFSVEAELIVSEVMSEISKRTVLLTSSLGSGNGSDIIHLFQSDIVGSTSTRPRHGRAFGNILKLQEEIRSERRKALTAYNKSVKDGTYPSEKEQVRMKEKELAKFLEKLEKHPSR